MKAIKLIGKMERTRRRVDFLFNDGQFRAKFERNEHNYRRQNKNSTDWLDYANRFYKDVDQSDA